MKLLLISTEKLPVPPIKGGAIQTYIAEILPYVSQIHDITVLSAAEESLANEEVRNGIEIVRVSGENYDTFSDEVFRYVKSQNFDLIHIFNRPRLVLPVRKAAPNAKITLSIHSDMFNAEAINPQEAKTVLNEVSVVMTASDALREHIEQQFPEAAPKLTTIHSAVNINRFIPGYHPQMRDIRNEVRNTNGLTHYTAILLSRGSSQHHAIDSFLQIMPNLSKKFRNLALVMLETEFVPEGVSAASVDHALELADQLSIPVVTPGFVAPKELPNWYAAADIFVSVSMDPITQDHFEAMGAGLPIVTTASGGNKEIIVHDVNGLIVENSEDPTEYEAKMEQLLANIPLQNRLKNKGREQAIYVHNWRNVSLRFLQEWENIDDIPSTNEKPLIQTQNTEANSEVIKEEASKNRQPSSNEDPVNELTKEATENTEAAEANAETAKTIAGALNLSKEIAKILNSDELKDMVLNQKVDKQTILDSHEKRKKQAKQKRREKSLAKEEKKRLKLEKKERKKGRKKSSRNE